MIKKSVHTIKIQIEKDEVLKEIREIKKEVKEFVKETTFELNKLNLKRKDILIVKCNCFLKQEEVKKLEKGLEKKLHRKVLVVSNNIEFVKIER